MRGNSETALCFNCKDDALIGVLHNAPEGKSFGILFVVGGPQYRVGSHRQFVLMARRFAACGYPTFRFDFRGMGDSEGDARSFTDIGEDIAAAVTEFRKQVDRLDGIVTIGLCDAASAILMEIQNLPLIRGMILMNPWVRTEASEAQVRIRHYYFRRIFQAGFWSKFSSGKVDIVGSAREVFSTAGRAVAAAFAGDKKDASPSSYIEKMRESFSSSEMPTLLLISERDLTANEFMSLVTSDGRWRKCVERNNVRIERLSAADHTFSRRADLERVCELSLEWLAETA